MAIFEQKHDIFTVKLLGKEIVVNIEQLNNKNELF
jgi:hypothetical protein